MIKKSEIADELFSESSIWDILENYESAHQRPIKAKWQSAYVMVATSIFATAYYIDGPVLSDIQGAAGVLSGFAISLAGTIFGVAIAGFSIFASTISSDILAKLASTKYKGGRVNNLTYIFSMFTYVLVTLFFVFLSTLLYEMMLGPRSAFVGMKHDLQLKSPYSDIAVLSYIVLLVGQITFVFSILFSFIWNLFQVLMVVAGAKIASVIKE
ncbi:hypothetical protein JMK10_00265 [Rhodovulum sulfidophilum]|uniref:hypothetical protein n=1 Tax=Rhodovulum sulfidophilum TaxID=35806 RepID=UPI0019239BA1|nr:hypothetical protein [Rhodovulum sulfidophilum]MBL3575595.1 hypothetical protein [Rhodovulum sulfidophilum]MCE8431776.1 hypothetical protein [Rhodovulum sulfidophilum]MCF4115296.1 hypothetical protein [Rhodovulum sulfidophilum]